MLFPVVTAATERASSTRPLPILFTLGDFVATFRSGFRAELGVVVMALADSTGDSAISSWLPTRRAHEIHCVLRGMRVGSALEFELNAIRHFCPCGGLPRGAGGEGAARGSYGFCSTLLVEAPLGIPGALEALLSPPPGRCLVFGG